MADRTASPERLLVYAAAVLAVAIPVVQVADLRFPGRAVLALLFVVLVPGAPLAALVRLRSFPVTLALTFAASPSVLLLLSTLLVVSEVWHPIIATGTMATVGLWLTWPALRARAGESQPRPPVGQHGRQRALSLGAVGGSVALWVVAVSTVDLDPVDGFGLLTAVGPAYWAGLAVLAVVGARELRRPLPDGVVLAVVVVALVVEMFGFQNAADSAAALSTGWLHVGFTQFITDNGAVAHYYDARFSWPGFFASAAILADAGGTGNAISFLRPAHVVNLLLALPALWSIALTITRTVPLAWLSLLVFLSLNWYEQDYFSPQATVFVLYVGVVATLLHLAPPPVELFGRDAPWRHPLRGLMRTVPRPDDSGPGLALGREALLLLVCSAVVVSHQLTPLNLLLVLALLVVTGATRMRGLWLLVALVFIAWFTFGAVEYWRGNVAGIFGEIGQVGSTVGSAVGERLVGDPVHSQMQSVRLFWSAGSVLVAVFALWRMRHSTWCWTLAGLALGPFSLILVQSYGGEVALRSFLYADPVLAPLVALTVSWALSAVPERVQTGALTAALMIGFVLLTTTRGANASFERETADDIAAVGVIFDAEPARKTIGVLQAVGFAGYRGVTEWEEVLLDPASCESADLVPCVELERPDFLLVTQSMDRIGVLEDGLAPGWSGRVVYELVARQAYVEIFRRPGVVALRRVSGG